MPSFPLPAALSQRLSCTASLVPSRTVVPIRKSKLHRWREPGHIQVTELFDEEPVSPNYAELVFTVSSHIKRVHSLSVSDGGFLVGVHSVPREAIKGDRTSPPFGAGAQSHPQHLALSCG